MRKLIFAINTTLDGCVDHTKQFADDETHEYFTHLMRDVDLQVFGRKPYQLMEAITSLEFMSMVMVHPEVPRNSNGAGLGPRR